MVVVRWAENGTGLVLDVLDRSQNEPCPVFGPVFGPRFRPFLAHQDLGVVSAEYCQVFGVML
jgi:hypothetical protein